MMMSSSMVMKKDNFTVLGHCCIIRYMRVHHPTFLHCAFTAHADLVVTRRASTGRSNLTLDFLYLSDGRPCNSSENRVNNINMLEVYHEIRGNLVMPSSASFLRCTGVASGVTAYLSSISPVTFDQRRNA